MKSVIRIDANLERIANASGYEVETLARALPAILEDRGLLEEPEQYWGDLLRVALGDCLVGDVCSVLSEIMYGTTYGNVPSVVFDSFEELVLLGAGDCPACGGDLELVHEDGHETGDGDMYTPSGFVFDRFVYRCERCGEIVITDKKIEK